jgi:hypothetical protein
MEAPVPGFAPRHGLCQGESGSGASLGASIAFPGFRSPGRSLTECLRVFSGGVSVQRRLLCAEREYFCDEQKLS